jgi:hypothetical protein
LAQPGTRCHVCATAGKEKARFVNTDKAASVDNPKPSFLTFIKFPLDFYL